jgi:hypothetical protein
MAVETNERLLRDLRILSLVRDGDKVYTLGGDLCLLAPGISSGFYRWTRGDSRQKSIVTVRALLHNALRSVEESVQVIERGDRRGVSKVRRLAVEIEAAVEGIRHMQTTYMEDATSRVTLGVLRDEVRERLLCVRSALEEITETS